MRTRSAPLRPGLDDEIWLRRQELDDKLLEALADGENVLLIGDPGSGKTTTLRYTARRLRQLGRSVVFVEASMASTQDQLLSLIASELPRVPGLEEPMSYGIDGRQVAVPPASGANDLIHRARRIRSLRRDTPHIILLDEFFDVGLAVELFGRARDALWDTGHLWVLAARSVDERKLLQPPGGAFWSTRIHMPLLSEPEIDAVLEGRELPLIDEQARTLGLGSRTVPATFRNVLAASVGLTRGAHTAAHAPNTTTASQAELVAELILLDRAVTVHDAELLETLGWSPSKLARVMKSLADDGIVREITEARETPGRPRKAYRLTKGQSG